MKLVTIVKVEYADATNSSLLTILVADIGKGNQEIPFIYREGDAHGLGPQVAAWLSANPDFPIGAYIPPPVVIPPRSKRQINAALILSGLTTDPEAWMDGILANIPDPVARALALNDRRHAPYYERSNPLFNDPALLALAGLTVEQVDAMWAAAGELPA